MLFNSFEFIFAFLPITLMMFFLLGRASRSWAFGWLIVASLFFYAWWRPINVAIIAPSVLVNFAFARVLLRLSAHQERCRIAQGVLTLGILFNVAFLGYFKYVNFLYTTLNDVAGTNFVLEYVILPLGISFITFQKIAFLIDVYGRRVESFTIREFVLFVLFYPQLIAGPIVHFREMMPQFRAISCRFDGEHLAVGLTLFIFGLFKKVVLADNMAGYITPIYESAAAGQNVSFFSAWIAAIGFTLQIYFDFSGYSDMALGLARCVGIRLPANFDSPLKATSIIDFWLRWHMTLTRFLTAYLYNPLVLWLTRRRMLKQLPGLGGRHPSCGAFFQLLVGPTLLTMFVSGLWHGAGYLFLLWGLLHGFYLVINHGWRLIDHQLGLSNRVNGQYCELVGFVLTFFSVVVAMVLFRSSTVAGAVTLLQGMIGVNGLTLPPYIIDHLGPFSQWLRPVVSNSMVENGQNFLDAGLWVCLLLAVALILPNSLQVMAPYEPALGIEPRHNNEGALVRLFNWSPSLPWAIVTAAIAGITVMRWGGKSEFLYWQF